MLQVATQALALGATLLALLLGLERHWDFWSVVRRATLAYLLVYAACGFLFALARLALDAEPAPDEAAEGAAGRGPEGSGTGGTDTAR